MPGLRNLRVISSWLALLVVVGTVGFRIIERWPWFDCFYMVLTTITTIGYGEVHPLSHTGRIFNVFVIVVGVGLVFLGIGALASSLLEFELRTFFGRRRMEREIGRLSDHYILCGAGRVGRSVARELEAEGVPFVIIENSEPKAERWTSNWLTIVGDATSEAVLRQARIEGALGLVAAASTDAINVYIVLTARTLNNRLKIIARASEEDAEKHLLKAGADSVISPYSFAGHRIAQSFLRPNVLDFLDTTTTRRGESELDIEEVLIEDSSPFAGQTIAGSRMRHEMGVIVLAIRRNHHTRVNPAPDDQIQPGDHLIVMGERSGLQRLEQSAAAKR